MPLPSSVCDFQNIVALAGHGHRVCILFRDVPGYKVASRTSAGYTPFNQVATSNLVICAEGNVFSNMYLMSSVLSFVAWLDSLYDMEFMPNNEAVPSLSNHPDAVAALRNWRVALAAMQPNLS